MLKFSIDYTQAMRGASSQLYKNISNQLKPIIHHTNKLIHEQYKTAFGFAYLPEDHDRLREYSLMAQRLKEYLDPEVILLIGIGGSHLGFKAIRDFLGDKHYLTWYELDNYIHNTPEILQRIEQHYQKKQRIAIIIISKSGTTSETLINASLIIDMARRYNPQSYHESVIIITAWNSKLASLAQQKGYKLLTMEPTISGRFSVLSAVGCFPLLLASYDVEALCAGARESTAYFLKDFDDNQAAISAALLSTYYEQNHTIINIFSESSSLNSLGMWYRQLIGESLGKSISYGPTPIISHATTDLHSMIQLYLAGPHDKITQFLSLRNKKSQEAIPQNEFTALLPVPEHSNIVCLHDMIMHAVRTSYISKQHPYIHIEIEHDTYALGQFLHYKMFEIIYMAQLQSIDPFNQPEVELYKQKMRDLII